jgi:nitrite reductase/ring-hydroxylating ferredoxin subunit/uncharacterized membrane protein
MALNIGRAISGFVVGDDDEMANWLDPLGDKLQQWLTKAIQDVGQPAHDVKDFLNGTWLGHPLHPALVAMPIGAWSTAAVLDLVGAERGADTAIGAGVLSSLPTAAAGVAQWHDTGGKERRTGTLHAVLNTAALGCYVGSLVARRAGHRSFGITLSTVGLGLVGWSGYLGGELAYTLGVGVNRTAWSPPVDDFQVAARADDLAEGKLAPGEVTVDGEKVPLVLLRRGEQILALHGSCTHMGGPLGEGKLIDGDCVECPWHGSRFDMWDGSVVRSPATAPQPRFEARIRDGNVEVRQAS